MMETFYSYIKTRKGHLMSHVSVKNNFIFIHVPKNAGVTILKCLNQAVPDIVKIQDIRDKLGAERTGWDDNHYLYKQTINTIRLPESNVTELVGSNPTVFGVIRNPFKRMVSLYYHRLRKPQYNEPKDNQCLEKGFEHWLLNTTHRSDHILTVKNQMDWFDGAPDPHIIKHEDLNEKWLREVSNTTTHDYKFGNHNISGKDHDRYYDLHTSATIEHVKKYFARDIQFGNYAYFTSVY